MGTKEKIFEKNNDIQIVGNCANCGVEYHIHQQTSSQQQTIERLRHIVRVILERSEKNRNHIEVWGNYHLLKEAEKLTETPNPSKELDEQQIEDLEVEERTERNIKVIGDFLEHCEAEGHPIPDGLFESYFNI